ncbi:Flp family type IVb pilin [Sphingomonas sp.]|jgi:pilus assembly protein Flp/PilA|uniref:Flp family type IVb pilin n=1 Tax=Sphingomonas sp. TaxID=28214 RepID=UPI002D7FBFC2|nr:Flp family type IVb pilin [Sphingomonas sp.]HEU0045031.1 Flp family type IVb pilin [Sphingomonas sp.]
MRRWSRSLWRLAAEQKAATAVEYGLIVAMIVIAMIAGLQAVGSQTTGMWNNVSSKIVNVR